MGKQYTTRAEAQYAALNVVIPHMVSRELLYTCGPSWKEGHNLKIAVCLVEVRYFAVASV